uniref:Uncharacterized protein n=1 Tax=Callorhinchus milii TaxID=7868 RepID=A0A4W3HXU0_CALMI
VPEFRDVLSATDDGLEGKRNMQKAKAKNRELFQCPNGFFQCRKCPWCYDCNCQEAASYTVFVTDTVSGEEMRSR